MKQLLILCLTFWATVSAKSDSYRTTENTIALKQKIRPYDVTNYISEVDVRVKNILLTSHLLFDSFNSPHPLIFYDPPLNPDYVLYSFNPLTISPKSNKVEYLFSSTKIILSSLNNINHNSKKNSHSVCLDKLTTNQFNGYRLSNINSRILSSTIPSTVNENDFIYAGTKRFTLTGDLPNLSTDLNPLHTSVTVLVVGATAIALHNNQSVAWWDGKGRNFFIREDGDYALYADKLGHFMGGYFTAYCAREAFVFSGFSWEQSILLGSIFGLVTQTYIEFKDGYAENTGFSPSDFTADFAGVTYFYLQHYIPFLQNFSPKWQYTPPEMIGVTPTARTQTFLDNYNSTTAWISVHVRNLFWGDQESFWPKWLNIGFGYGINGYYTTSLSSRFVIGIDYNLVELLPDWFPLWNWLKQTLNGIKLPAPALEFSKEGTQFKLLYPFTISISSLQF